MSEYQCSVCEHVFEHSTKVRPICPKCHSIFTKKIDEKEEAIHITDVIPGARDLVSLPKTKINDLDLAEINARAQEIEEQLKNVAGFSPEDLDNIREDILNKWKAHIQQQIEKEDEYARTIKVLEPKMRKIVTHLESLAGKLPTGWDEFLSRELKTMPSYFRNMERTRRRILEKWKDYLDQFESKFNNEWEEVFIEINQIDGAYKKCAETCSQAAKSIENQLKSELGTEKATGIQQEQQRHKDWLHGHIQQVLNRENSEKERQEFWNERFSAPQQLWLVLREEWRLAHERRSYDLFQQRSKQQSILDELRNWFENKKQFYLDKISSWTISLQELSDNKAQND